MWLFLSPFVVGNSSNELSLARSSGHVPSFCLSVQSTPEVIEFLAIESLRISLRLDIFALREQQAWAGSLSVVASWTM